VEIQALKSEALPQKPWSLANQLGCWLDFQWWFPTCLSS